MKPTWKGLELFSGVVVFELAGNAGEDGGSRDVRRRVARFLMLVRRGISLDDCTTLPVSNVPASSWVALTRVYIEGT
jgi:hypothetical protein